MKAPGIICLAAATFALGRMVGSCEQDRRDSVLVEYMGNRISAMQLAQVHRQYGIIDTFTNCVSLDSASVRKHRQVGPSSR